MASWKPTFESLSAHFKCEPQQDMSVGNDTENLGTAQSEHTEPSPTVDVKEKLVHKVWEEMFGHVLRSHPMIMEHLFSITGSNAESNIEVKVVKEVFKREMIIALEDIYLSRVRPNGKEESPECLKEHASVDSLKHSLKDMTDKTLDAEKSLRVAVKEKCDLQYTCEQYKEELENAAKILEVVKEENKALTEDKDSLVDSMKLLNTEVKELREAKRAEEVNALRSQHDAEMAHLIAKQSALQAKLLDKQLREANGSSKIMQKRVEELQRVQNEMKSVLVNNSCRSESRIMGAQYNSPIHRSSRPLGQLGTALTRRKQGPDRGEAKGRTRNESNRSQGTQVKREGSSPLTTARQFQSGESNTRNAGEVQQTARRRFTRGWLTGSNGERRVPDSHDERARFLSRFLHLGRGAFGNENREADDHHHDGRGMRNRMPWLAELKRLISPSTYSGTPNDRRSIGTTPQTLEALGENLETLRDIVDNKQKEIDRLRRELRTATLQSDALERLLRREQHKRVQRNFGCSAHDGASSAIDAGSGVRGIVEGGKRNSGDGEEVSP